MTDYQDALVLENLDLVNWSSARAFPFRTVRS